MLQCCTLHAPWLQLTQNRASFSRTHALCFFFNCRSERCPSAVSPSGRCATSTRRRAATWGGEVLARGSRSRSAASTTPLRALHAPQGENRSRLTSPRSAAASRRGRRRVATESTFLTPPRLSSRCRLAIRLVRLEATAAARRWLKTRRSCTSAQAQCVGGAALATRAAAPGCESTFKITNTRRVMGTPGQALRSRESTSRCVALPLSSPPATPCVWNSHLGFSRSL
jgi:hypothetical protein